MVFFTSNFPRIVIFRDIIKALFERRKGAYIYVNMIEELKSRIIYRESERVAGRIGVRKAKQSRRRGANGNSSRKKLGRGETSEKTRPL